MVVNTKLFRKAVQTAKRYKISDINIQIHSNTLVVRVTDKEHGVAITVPCSQSTISTNIKVSLNPLLNALKAVKAVNNENISIEIGENNYSIGSYTFPCTMVEEESFPQIDNKAKLSVDSLNLIKAFKKVSPAIYSNNPKFELSGALLSINANGCDIVGTDNKRLALMHLNQTGSQELKLIIPKKAIIEIQKLFTDAIDIYYDDTNLIIQNQNYFFFTRLISGRYPDYARIIPKNKKYSFKLPKIEMIESIKMITSICQDITMVFSSNSIIFKSFSNDIGEAKTELLINLELENSFELNVNSRYFLDFIMQVDSENFEIILNEQSLPFLLQDGAFQTVIMPIIL